MSKVRVSPAPIQRNTNDVAIELTKLYLETYNVELSPENLARMYAGFYAIAAVCENRYLENILSILPDEIRPYIEEIVATE